MVQANLIEASLYHVTILLYHIFLRTEADARRRLAEPNYRHNHTVFIDLYGRSWMFEKCTQLGAWCPEEDSNLHGRKATSDLNAGASTNSAIWARGSQSETDCPLIGARV